MSARVYLLKRVNGCKDVFMQDEQCMNGQVYSVFILLIFLFY